MVILTSAIPNAVPRKRPTQIAIFSSLDLKLLRCHKLFNGHGLTLMTISLYPGGIHNSWALIHNLIILPMAPQVSRVTPMSLLIHSVAGTPHGQPCDTY